MPFVCDAHAHFYPNFSLVNALQSASDNLGLLWDSSGASGKESPVFLLCLAERFDCNFFSSLIQHKTQLPEGYSIALTEEKSALWIEMPNNRRLLILAGRQIVSRERLEILALTEDLDLPDGLPFAELIPEITRSGALAVLNWAPGKWFFNRGKLVSQIIQNYSPSELLIGDTTLRPTIWLKPVLMRLAERRGFKVLAGSDPLPLAGEERILGRYGIYSEGRLNLNKPVSSFREHIRNSSPGYLITGQRSSVFRTGNRIIRNAWLKKKSQ